jgi:quinol monooxygenase YgiN
MILVTIKIAVRSAKQKELSQTLGALERLVRKEAGCVRSTFYREAADDNALCLLEEWATQEHLDTHLRSDNFRVLRGAVKLLNGPAEMRFHSVSRTLGEEAVEAARERRASSQSTQVSS